MSSDPIRDARQKAFEEAKKVRGLWENMAGSSNIKVSTIRRHFDAMGDEVNRLNAEIARLLKENQALNAIEGKADAAACQDAVKLTDLKAEVTRLEEENKRLQSEIKNIHRQHAAERPQW